MSQTEVDEQVARREIHGTVNLVTATAGLLDDRGAYNASGNTFPAAGGSGQGGDILKGDIWRVSVAGTLGGTPVKVGDWVRAMTDGPGQTAGNWGVASGNLGYTAENAANKSTDIGADTGSNTKYPSVKAVEDAIADVPGGSPYQSYQATLLQTGTNAPTEVTTIKDDLDIAGSWEYVNVGTFKLHLGNYADFIDKKIFLVLPRAVTEGPDVIWRVDGYVYRSDPDTDDVTEIWIQTFKMTRVSLVWGALALANDGLSSTIIYEHSHIGVFIYD